VHNEQIDETSLRSSASLPIPIYKGRYPMVDHIRMPRYEAVNELFTSASFEIEGDGGTTRDRPQRSAEL
jgi:hypothetical protein